MVTIELYSKPGCHLCDLAKTILQKLKTDYPFQMREINIESDGLYREKYKNKVPVIHINGHFSFYGRISETALRHKLNEYDNE